MLLLNCFSNYSVSEMIFNVKRRSAWRQLEATARKGRQTPTQSAILAYKKSSGKEAVSLYEATGRRFDRWQKILTDQIMATTGKGLWRHSKFGYSVPRRNGKTEVVFARVLWGLKKGQRILYTAHRATTAHSAWERICDLLSAAGVLYASYKAYGLESISSDNFPGIINFRTRSAKGGLGEGYDLLIIDEAQEYTDDQQSALKYVVTDSKNPQTIFLGTPPTVVSAGTVFMNMRNDALAGKTENTGWAEWSIDRMSAQDDRDAWYETNPALGTRLTERAIADEMGSDDIDFNIQRLGLWLTYNQKSAISENDWTALQTAALPELTGQLHVGIKFAHDGKTVAMAIAVKTSAGGIFVEAIDDRPMSGGLQWILSFLAAADVREVVVDGANGQQALADAMKKNRLRAPVMPTVKDVIAAGVLFEMGITEHTISHRGQFSLAQAATNCDHRAIGSNGGFGYRSLIEDVDVALLESTVLACWSCKMARDKKKQHISY